MLTRRGLIGTLLAAPAIIRTPGLLMPVKVPLVVLAPTLTEIIRQHLQHADRQFHEVNALYAEYARDRQVVRLPSVTWRTLYHPDGTPLRAADA